MDETYGILLYVAFISIIGYRSPIYRYSNGVVFHWLKEELQPLDHISQQYKSINHFITLFILHTVEMRDFQSTCIHTGHSVRQCVVMANHHQLMGSQLTCITDAFQHATLKPYIQLEIL